MRYLSSLALGLAGAGLLAASAMAQDFTMKLSSPTNNDANLAWMQRFEELVEERSDGHIDVQLFPANQLGQIPSTIDGVSFGTIEATLPASGFFIGLDPRFEVFDVPGLFSDLAHAQRTLADPELADHYSGFGSAAGMRTIAVYANAPLALVSQSPVAALADMEGMKLRVAGSASLQSLPFQAFGASPVSLPLGESLPGLQTGVIDGMLASIPVYTTFKFYDVAKNMTILPETFLIVAIVANEEFLQSIGPELETVVLEAAQEAVEAANAWTDAQLDGQLDTWRRNEGQLHMLSADDSATWRKTIGDSLPEAFEANPVLKAELDAFREAASRHAAD